MLMPKRSRIEGIVRQESLQIYCHVLVHFSGRVFPEKPGGGGGGCLSLLRKTPQIKLWLVSFLGEPFHQAEFEGNGEMACVASARSSRGRFKSVNPRDLDYHVTFTVSFLLHLSSDCYYIYN